jgi:hypothetical protein
MLGHFGGLAVDCRTIVGMGHLEGQTEDGMFSKFDKRRRGCYSVLQVTARVTYIGPRKGPIRADIGRC